MTATMPMKTRGVLLGLSVASKTGGHVIMMMAMTSILCGLCTVDCMML